MNLDQLKYPIGKFSRPTTITTHDITQWITEIEMLPAQVRTAVESLNDAQLDTPYRPEGWTVRQLAHHLPDSHLNSYIRFKLALTEDNPTIKPYMEERWAELPDGKTAPIATSLDLLESLHKRWVQTLHNITPEQWQRTFFHPESKKEFPLDVVLSIYVWHGKHHLAHITELKKRMDWR